MMVHYICIASLYFITDIFLNYYTDSTVYNSGVCNCGMEGVPCKVGNFTVLDLHM